MSVEIETIGIDIDGTKIILDKGAAKELYFKLKELFGDKTPTYIPYPVTYPAPVYPTYPTYPTYPWVFINSGTAQTNGTYPSNYTTTITCSANTLLTFT